MVLVKVTRPERFWISLNSSQLLIHLLFPSSLCLMFLCYLSCPPSKGDLSYSFCCLSWFWFCQSFLTGVWQDVLPICTLVLTCSLVLLQIRSLVWLASFVGHISYLCKMLAHFVISQCYKILIQLLVLSFYCAYATV